MSEPERKQPTCAERIEENWESRREDLSRALIIDRIGGPEEWQRLEVPERVELLQEAGLSVFMARRDDCPEEFQPLTEYGLCFDYVAPGTFGDQDEEEEGEEGYWLYQLSWGGPSDEIRFFSSEPDWKPYRIEYWFLDWFDGASRSITADPLASELWDLFDGFGTVKSEYEKAQ